MKNIVLLLVALFTLVACKKEVPNLDPFAQLSLNAPTSKAIPSAPYSMDTVVRYAFETMFWVDKYNYALRQGVPKHDLENLKFWIGEAQSVVEVDKNGIPQLGFLVSNNLRDLVVVASRQRDNHAEWVDAYKAHDLNQRPPYPAYIYDTIGYVPNRAIKAAEAEIHKAFNAGDYDRCTQLFETAYIFQPITGAEWRALKAKNEQ